MSQPLYIFSSGLWRLREEIAILTGLVPRRAFGSIGASGAVAGWGNRPTAERARAAARQRGLPYIAIEDGFLRSLKPGPAQRPSSMVLDRIGIYYDASRASDLETVLATATFDEADRTEARHLLAEVAARRLSKYNHGSEKLPPELAGSRPMVLVVDQTVGDQSIRGGLADRTSFSRMLDAAVAENPGAIIVAKSHPEVIGGAKSGYLAGMVRQRPGILLLTENINPWVLFDRRPRVYTVSSQVGFEAIMAGLSVICFGAPFYAGWGLTDDRIAIERRGRNLTREDLAVAVYLRYSRYFDVWRRQAISAFEAVEQLDFQRRHYLGNNRRIVCLGLARWKRRAVAAMLDGPNGPPAFVARPETAVTKAQVDGADIAAWGATALSLRPRFAAQGITTIAIEDGFIRSVGLGAALVEPMSLVFDRTGLYYDSRSPSDLENDLTDGSFDGPLLIRAARLRQRLVAEKVTKYNLSEAALPLIPAGRKCILVPGQVADDWAVRLGGGRVGSNVNLELLVAVRQSHPQAHVIFKPHPDVEQLGRPGALAPDQLRTLADTTVGTASLEPLFGVADSIETYSSLAGFEALLRGLPVTVHGSPFYAGWALTTDRSPVPRRGRRRSIDELVAACLIRYPHYWDPQSGLPCPPEVVLDRLRELRQRPVSPKDKALRLVGRAVICWRSALSRFAGRGGKVEF